MLPVSRSKKKKKQRQEFKPTEKIEMRAPKNILSYFIHNWE